MSTINQSGWRLTTLEAGEAGDLSTFTGNRALMLEEPLIFEIGSSETTGVDFGEAPRGTSRLGGLERSGEIGLPGLSEPETVRHYTRLSRQNYAIDLGLFPLGSCTMKHNPRLNERMARLPGFADIHPLAPVDRLRPGRRLAAAVAVHDHICREHLDERLRVAQLRSGEESPRDLWDRARFLQPVEWRARHCQTPELRRQAL